MSDRNEASAVRTEGRVLEALDRARPYLRSHSGEVELLSIEGGTTVRLRLRDNCHECPFSAVTTKLVIEDTIRRAAPEITDIDVEGALAWQPPSGTGPGGRPLLPLISAEVEVGGDSGAAASPWKVVEEAHGLAAGDLRSVIVGSESVLFCNAGGVLYAYRDRCPSCTAELSGGRLDGAVLGCPACPERYEVRLAGRGERRPALQLMPLPLLPGDGTVHVALPAEGVPERRPVEQAGV
ncbi:Fe-S cluster biogenesis protein NfuA [Halopolyspora algeriensis]|uniref:Fe-S cluster biogenesis protein NfuA n=1 Tax=Halopolyspora algeriensis TaxID=1500506 RepID=A0A368VI94_9ACTN|nr:NifU family protein [Halopolyspora algeriensis]RCW40384.1 Fe-S cluster biogenesis protein NfuA [Halopolyspora algeriensis]TQM53668.1 Fe-S cluster biogenesis protein NfuA [Halopolyspora algeriensis]